MSKKEKIVEEMVADLEKKHFARREIKNEIIAAKRVKIPGSAFDKVGVFSAPLVKSKEDLEVYGHIEGDKKKVTEGLRNN